MGIINPLPQRQNTAGANKPAYHLSRNVTGSTKIAAFQTFAKIWINKHHSGSIASHNPRRNPRKRRFPRTASHCYGNLRAQRLLFAAERPPESLFIEPAFQLRGGDIERTGQSRHEDKRSDKQSDINEDAAAGSAMPRAGGAGSHILFPFESKENVAQLRT